MQSIHGHEILKMLIDAKDAYTRERLGLEVSQKFGENVRFHACQGSDMTLDGLMEYLSVRGKIQEKNGRLYSATEHMCSHE
ncbi:MAG: YecH family protein [Chlorobiales bacterium]|nr:YecH family protein [Chlorobiales bacterium]